MGLLSFSPALFRSQARHSLVHSKVDLDAILDAHVDLVVLQSSLGETLARAAKYVADAVAPLTPLPGLPIQHDALNEALFRGTVVAFDPANRAATEAAAQQTFADKLARNLQERFESDDAPKAELAELASDVADVVWTFAATTRLSTLEVLLTGVSNDRCKKFHVDSNYLRLLRTYEGKGTEWLREQDFRRAVLRAGFARDASEANAELVGIGKIQRAKAGDWVLIKGSLFPGASQFGGVHRSPPVDTCCGERRLLLVVTGQP